MQNRFMAMTALIAGAVSIMGVATLAGALTVSEKQMASFEECAFLQGNWISKSEKFTTEERWSAPRGQLMMGVSHTYAGERTMMFEFLRIENRRSGIVYVAMPNGSEATEFPLVDAAPGRVAFANPEHDFPQRIEYTLSGETLTATISGNVGGKEKTQSWTFSKE